MKNLTIVSTLIFGILFGELCNVYSVDVMQPDGRIINGQRAEHNDFRYQVAIKFQKYKYLRIFAIHWTCAGSIISWVWILTAAHCAEDAIDAEVNSGSLERDNGNSVLIKSEHMKLHPEYNSSNFNTQFDIALLFIPAISPTESVQIIKLPSMRHRDTTYEGKECLIAGWGHTSNGNEELSNYLLFAKMKVISNDECCKHFLISNNTICTTPINNGMVYDGDSGGPLTIVDEYGAAVQIAVVSRSAGCESRLPALFERLTTSLDWIKKTSGVAYY